MAFRFSSSVMVLVMVLIFGGATRASAFGTPFLQFEQTALEGSLVLVEVSVNANDAVLKSLAVSALTFAGMFNEVTIATVDVPTTTVFDTFNAIPTLADDYKLQAHLDTIFFTRSDEWGQGLPDCGGVVHHSATLYEVCLGTGAGSMHNILKLANLVVPAGTTISYSGSIGRQGEEVAVQGSILAIPEPTTHALLLGALGLLVAVERRASFRRS